MTDTRGFRKSSACCFAIEPISIEKNQNEVDEVYLEILFCLYC